MSYFDLPTLANDPRRAAPKGEPSVLVRKAKKQTKAQAEAAFRAAVWTRDEGKSRASGIPLSKSGTESDRLGEVHHVLKRSTHPEDRLNAANGILLSKTEHRMAEARCAKAPEHHYLEITGPADMGKGQRFTWRDSDGAVLRVRLG